MKAIVVGALLIAAPCVGCGNHFTPSPRMANAAAPLAPSPDAATLVFVRPSLYAGILNPGVFVDGKYAGDVEADSRVVVRVPAGHHTVTSGMHDFTTKGCRQLEADVESGKIYFVETTVAFGLDLFAVHPSDATKLHEWLFRAQNTRELAVPTDPLEPKEEAECRAKAAEHLAGDDPKDRMKHVLTPSDGFAAVP